MILGLQPRALPLGYGIIVLFGKGTGIYHQGLQPSQGTPLWLSSICTLNWPLWCW